MKIRSALAALAIATLTLTGCASETAGTAAPVAGADRPAAAGSAGSAGTDETDETDETDAEEPTTAEAPGEGTPTEEDEGTEGGDDTTSVPDVGGCEQLLTLAQDFSTKILQKATQGGVTQADVDDVFSDENMAALPAELQEDAATLKDLSQQMVGKEITELTEILPQVQTTFESIAEKATSACGG